MDPFIALQGNLVADPTRRVTASGSSVARFRLASSGRRFDRERNEWVDRSTLFIDVVCWRQLADNVYQTLHKGDTVVVTGRLDYSEWEDAQSHGQRNRYEITAQTVAPSLTRYVATLSRPNRELERASRPSPGGADEANPWGEPATVPAESPAA